MGILGMAPCDGTDAVPPNARSHTVLLAGTLIGDAQARPPLKITGSSLPSFMRFRHSRTGGNALLLPLYASFGRAMYLARLWHL